MKRVLIYLAMFFGTVISAQAFSTFDPTYYSNTATAWTYPTTTAAIIAGTVAVQDYSPECKSLIIFEKTLTCDMWLQFIMTASGTPDVSGPWLPVPAGTGFFSDQTNPPGGIAVRVTNTATIQFFSKK